MTSEDFHLLPLDKQESFINEGGIISSSVGSSLGTIQSATLAEKEQVETKVVVPIQPIVKDEVLSEFSSPQPVSSPYTEGFDIRDPVELLFLLDDDVISGRVILHNWQIQHMLDFADEANTSDFPYQSVVRAPNESGKDKYVIAAEAVWICMRYRETTCPITSSSGFQLDNQTCRHIKKLAESANRKWGKIWQLNYRNYKCLPTESEMFCYATDEAGKAEGFHPIAFGKKMAIFASEDKTIPDEINIAQNKCSGYTHRVHVSTPGLPMGHFHDLCSMAVDRKTLKGVKDVKPGDYIQYHITYKECSHIKEFYVEQMKRDLPGGEFGAAFKSQFLAEFGTTDEMVVIPYTYVWKAKNKSIEDWIQESYNKAGLDLSDGGDETVLMVRNGNRMLKLIPFRFDNTEDTIKFLEEKFEENNLTNKEALIFADCGGLGKPMLDRMKRKGWSNIRYRDNRAKSTRPKTYKNWGSDSWFNFGTLLAQNELIILNDPQLIRQLSTRYYKIIDGAIHQLLSKLESRSRGYPSPDRADATVLGFSDYQSTYVSYLDAEDREEPFKEKEEEKQEIVNAFTLQKFAKGSDAYKGKWRVNEGQKDFRELEEQVSNYNKQLLTK